MPGLSLHKAQTSLGCLSIQPKVAFEALEECSNSLRTFPTPSGLSLRLSHLKVILNDLPDGTETSPYILPDFVHKLNSDVCSGTTGLARRRSPKVRKRKQSVPSRPTKCLVARVADRMRRRVSLITKAWFFECEGEAHANLATCLRDMAGWFSARHDGERMTCECSWAD